MHKESQEEDQEINECAIYGCNEKATTFTAVYIYMDENHKRKNKSKEAVGSPLVLCHDHAEGRKEIFESVGRRVKIIENFQS
jgi:hypothetical protein